MSAPNNLRALDEIAHIRTGFTFREKIEELGKNPGNAYIAQIKDVRRASEATGSFKLIPSQLPRIDWTGKDNAFVKPGTVLLPSRGDKGGYFLASYLVEDEASLLPVVVSSQFLLIEPKAGVLPEFLCWSLNRPAMQHWLSEGIGAQGTGIVMLNTKVAKELRLEIPSLAIQQKILHLNQLWEQEQQVTRDLLKNREIMLHSLFQKLLKDQTP